MKDNFTTEECAQFIGHTPGAVRNLVRKCAIPYRKPGGRLMFLRREIEQCIENAPGLKLEDMKESLK